MRPFLPLLFLAAAIPAHGVFVNFDSSSDFNLFTEGAIAGGTNWSYSTADGVGTPNGAAAIATSTEQLNYTAGTFSIGGGSLWTTSVYINGMTLSGQSSATGSTLIASGYVTEATGNFSTGDVGSIGFYARVNNTSANNYQLQFINKPTSASGAVVASSTAFNLTADNWYKLTLSVSEVSPGVFGYTTSFEDYGVDGISAPVAVVSALSGSSVSNSAVAADSTLYAGTVSRPFTGTGYIDNFSVVPEPSTVTLLTAAGVLLLRRRRRNG